MKTLGAEIVSGSSLLQTPILSLTFQYLLICRLLLLTILYNLVGWIKQFE